MSNSIEEVYLRRLAKALRLVRANKSQIAVAEQAQHLGYKLTANEVSRYERLVQAPSIAKLLAFLAGSSMTGNPDLCELQQCMKRVERGGDDLFDAERSLMPIADGADSTSRKRLDAVFGDRQESMKDQGARDKRIEALEAKVDRLTDVVERHLTRRERDVQKH